MLTTWLAAAAIATGPVDRCGCVGVATAADASAISSTCLLLHVNRDDASTPRHEDGSLAGGWLPPPLVRFSTRRVEISTLLEAHGWHAFRRVMQGDERPLPAAARDSVAWSGGNSKSAVLCASFPSTDVGRLAAALRECAAVDSVHLCRADLFWTDATPEPLLTVLPDWPRSPEPGERAEIWVRVWIRDSGTVSRVRIERTEWEAVASTTGSGEVADTMALEVAALEAASRWVFRPASEYGAPMPAEIVVPFAFGDPAFGEPTRPPAAPRRTTRGAPPPPRPAPNL